ncbi:MAG: hypothetical protein R2695_06535 [Acidimicrobiales bacterium]
MALTAAEHGKQTPPRPRRAGGDRDRVRSRVEVHGVERRIGAGVAGIVQLHRVESGRNRAAACGRVPSSVVKKGLAHAASGAAGIDYRHNPGGDLACLAQRRSGDRRGLRCC